MYNEQTLQAFREVMEVWANALNEYSMDALTLKPDAESWSMGQLYNHLFRGTLDFHLKELRQAASTNQNRRKFKSVKGFMVFHVIKGFPDIRIKVPPSERYTPRQPRQKEELLTDITRLREEIEDVPGILNNGQKGKTAHPAFSYLNAREWFRLIPMHFRHHLAQKERLDAFLREKR
ncbi:MAG: DinB family protein [Calditrichaeota bacterium]|nr:MAG: DinB family protein [Calditrichota bacterium]